MHVDSIGLLCRISNTLRYDAIDRLTVGVPVLGVSTEFYSTRSSPTAEITRGRLGDHWSFTVTDFGTNRKPVYRGAYATLMNGEV